MLLTMFILVPNLVEASGDGAGDSNDDVCAVKDEDFKFVKSSVFNAQTKDGETGYFKYIGTKTCITIPDVIQGASVTSYDMMFYNYNNDIINVEKINGSNPNVTSARGMFTGQKASSLDLSGLDTSGVTNMDSMFSYNQSTDLNLTGSFNTANVTDMDAMFFHSKAKNLDLSNFNTSKVTTMVQMFSVFDTTGLDLKPLDTSSVTDMGSMFSDITFNASGYVPGNYGVLDVSPLDTRKVTNMSAMFYGSKASDFVFENYPYRNFKTNSVKNMTGMFGYTLNLKTLRLRTFNYSSLQNFGMDMILDSSRVSKLCVSATDAKRFKSASRTPSGIVYDDMCF